MKLFNRRKKEKALYDQLEKVVFKFPGTKAEFRLSDYMAGTLVTGASRTGKTSSVLRFFVKEWFKAGYGGLYTATRVGDAHTIRKWAEECGRSDDIILFDRSSKYTLAPLEYEMKRKDGGNINQIANNLLMIHEVISNFEAGSSTGKEDPFWKNSFKSLVVMSLSLLKLSGNSITWENLRKLALDSFSEDDVHAYAKHWEEINAYQIRLKENRALAQNGNDPWHAYEDWMDSNFFLKCFDRANSRKDLNDREMKSLETLMDYWMRQLPKLAPKTKSIIFEILQSVTRPFETDGILREKFSEGVSYEIDPSETFLKNKIVILGFGVKEYGIDGLCATAITKLIYQQAWERRNLEEEGPDANCVMLMIDEFQYYINPTYDSLFTSTAGGSLVANLLATQNIDNVIMGMGSQSPESRARSLLGNLSTKCHCANSNFATNKWASDMIGSHFVDTTSITIDGSHNGSHGFSQTYHPKVPPDYFTTLKTGKRQNNFCVETIVTQTGRTWDTGDNYREVTFKQNT